MEQADDNSFEELNYDLPLLANVRDVLIRHYAIRLSCDFEKKQLSGHAIVFLDFLSREQSENRFELILDCKDITIESVQTIIFENEDEINAILRNSFIFRKENIDIWSSYKRSQLFFKLTDWSLNIWSEKNEQFPSVVCITYLTNETGSSLTWTKDQNERYCVFTQGALINNRSLVPCQEPPVAMATWQAKIETDIGVVVLMSGDKQAEIERLVNGRNCYFYYTNIVSPISTLALAIGYWNYVDVITEKEASMSSKIELSLDEKCLHELFPCYIKSELNRTLVECRLFGVDKFIDTAKQELVDYIPRFMKACCSLLGRHPFPRLDILIVPRCFGSLGLANPHLLFVSQSLFCGDGTMKIHFAHELCHSWFGLSIGALDWTEEWLSEGFATYMEDQVYSMAMNWSEEEKRERCEIRSLLRYRLLSSEMENTDKDLQVLRRDNEEKSLSNGMNPWKCFSQVHYLKGYFLLRRLSLNVGENEFNCLIRDYVTKYHGCLISSKEIFQIYFDRFPQINNLTMDNIYRDWLDFPGMPKDLLSFKISSGNSIYCRVFEEVEKWKAINRNNLRRVKKFRLQIEFNQLSGDDELVLFLELLLEEKRLSSTTLSLLNDHFHLDQRNAHVKHRWLELVVKHDYRKEYSSVHKFLVDHQSMGIYLYSELIYSGRQNQLELAKSIFAQLQNEIDICQRKTIKDMLKDRM